MEDIRASGSPRQGQRQLQVRDNDQRTCFLLVWSDSGDGAAVLATSRTFRTIRTAISEGVARFGTMAVRRKMPLSGAAQPPERV